jgi:hypothetical protein
VDLPVGPFRLTRQCADRRRQRSCQRAHQRRIAPQAFRQAIDGCARGRLAFRRDNFDERQQPARARCRQLLVTCWQLAALRSIAPATGSPSGSSACPSHCRIRSTRPTARRATTSSWFSRPVPGHLAALSVALARVLDAPRTLGAGSAPRPVIDRCADRPPAPWSAHRACARPRPLGPRHVVRGTR